MRILFVSDCSTKDNVGQELEKSLLEELRNKGHKFMHYNVSEAEIKNCLGCFKCWTATPGMCIFSDITRDICRDMMSSDAYIILSEVKYGGYSSEIKSVLDRSICNVLPFFKMIKGEMHHVERYDKYPELCMLGYGRNITSEEEYTFRAVNQANAVNFQKEKAETYICRSLDETEAAVNCIIKYLEKKGEV